MLPVLYKKKLSIQPAKKRHHDIDSCFPLTGPEWERLSSWERPHELPGCSWLYPVGVRKLLGQRVDTGCLSGQPVPLPDCPYWEKYPVSMTALSTCLLSSQLHHCQEPDPSHWGPPLRYWGCCWVLSTASPPGWTSPLPLSSPHRAGTPTPSILISPAERSLVYQLL